jgi:hypothetical protein
LPAFSISSNSKRHTLLGGMDFTSQNPRANAS